MKTIKSKGERLNWSFISDIIPVSTKEVFDGIQGKVLTDTDLKERQSKRGNGKTFLVP